MCPSYKRRYLKVQLSKGSVSLKRDFMVHRLVAMTYLPNPNNYPEVNHKDGNTHNNEVGNLEWCSTEYNRNHATHTLKRFKGTSNPRCKLSEQDVLEVRVWAKYYTLERISKAYGVTIQMIWQIKTRRSWTHLTRDFKRGISEAKQLEAEIKKEISDA
jgi:hypothetical protein